MRLSNLSIAAVLLSSSFLFAQHHPGGGSSGGSSGGGSSPSPSSSSSASTPSPSYSGGSSHSSYSGGSSGSSHSSGGGYGGGGGGSHSAGSSHSSGRGHSSAGNHGGSPGYGSESRSSSHTAPAHGTVLRGTEPSTSTHPTHGTVANPIRPIHEPVGVAPGRMSVPEKRGFFAVLFRPFHRPHPRPDPRPNLYLPRPICPNGHCQPRCPVGQVRNGGVCTSPALPTCIAGQVWNGEACGQTFNPCYAGAIWTGSACVYRSYFSDRCLSLRFALRQQEERARAAESLRRSACANGPAQECSEATAAWQYEENLVTNLVERYRQCQMRSIAAGSAGYGLSVYDSTPWFDFLTFDLRD